MRVRSSTREPAAAAPWSCSLTTSDMAPDAFVSIGAFASLHVGVTGMILLMARYYGLRRISRVLAVYLGAVMVATVYFGWHYVVDDIAGVLLAVTAVLLGRWTVSPPRWRRDVA